MAKTIKQSVSFLAVGTLRW